jgi:hypothetical protein
MARDGLHEQLRRAEDTVGPSDRRFGLTIGGVFALIAIWKAVTWSAWGFLWAGLAAAFAISALAQPLLLAPFNRLWLKFGLLLHRIVSPVAMAILFYATILPIGLLMKALGKDPLRLKLEKGASSYWLPRSDDRPPEASMRQQF